MLAGINVFIGLLNMFPLLPFDGGHAAIATYERIRSRTGRRRTWPTSARWCPVAMAVMTFLGFLLFTGLYLDIAKPFPELAHCSQTFERRATRQIHVGKVPSVVARRSRCSR